MSNVVVSELVASPAGDGKSDNKIDIIKLAAQAWRWRYVILATCVVTTGLGTGYALSRTPNFLVKSIIEIGTLGASSGFRLAETTDVVANKINSVYAVTAARDIAASSETVTARAVRNSNSVIVESVGPRHQAPTLEALQHKVFELVSADHGRLFNVARSDLTTQVKLLTVELDRLKDQSTQDVELNALRTSLTKAQRDLVALEEKRAYDTSSKALQDQIANAENSLKDIQAENKMLALTLKQKDISEVNIKAKIARLDTFLESAIAGRQKLMASITSSSDSLAALMLGSEIQRLTSERDQLQQQLTVGLLLERSRLETDLAANVRKQTAPQATIDKAKSELQKLDLDRNEKIADIKQTIAGFEARIIENQRARTRAIDIQTAKIKDLETKFGSITETRLLASPLLVEGRRDFPSSLIIAMSSLLGLIAGYALAVAAALASKVKASLAAPDVDPTNGERYSEQTHGLPVILPVPAATASQTSKDWKWA